MKARGTKARAGCGGYGEVGWACQGRKVELTYKDMENKYRIIVLGAGFSRPAGFPLASELWRQIRELAPHLEGRASKLNDDLKTYFDYLNDCDGMHLKSEEVNFEKFMQFLDIEHFLGPRGSDTWSTEGNEGTVVTKTLIGRILAQSSAALSAIPELYLEFARRLRPHDVIITFNYDTLLELALDAVAKPYRLFPTRYKMVSEFGATGGDDRDEVVILKVHGSIDWFDRKGFEWLEALHKREGAPPPEDVIFSRATDLRLRPVVDGPRFEDDPLRTIYRAGNLAGLYSRDFMFLATPRMLPPSSAKIIYARQIGDVWNGMNFGGIVNFGMAIIGFSLAPQDEYARQIVYSLVTNYQRENWDETVFGKRKTPLVLVNYFENESVEQEFRERYRFVDWNRTRLFRGGFDAETLDAIFA